MTDNQTGQPGADKKARNTTLDGFRLKYINQRLIELDTERDRLVGERKTIRALRQSNSEKPQETKD